MEKITLKQVSNKLLKLKHNNDSMVLLTLSIYIHRILNRTDKYDNDYPKGIWILSNEELEQILYKLHMEQETVIIDYISDGGEIYKLPSKLLFDTRNSKVYCPVGYKQFHETSQLSFVPIGKRSPVLYNYVERESFCIIL